MKKILIISEHFAPENSIGALRMTKVAKYLSRANYKITVLTAEKSLDVADDLALNGLENVEIKRVPILRDSFAKKITDIIRKQPVYKRTIKSTVAQANADFYEPTKTQLLIKDFHDFVFFMINYQKDKRFAKNAKKYIKKEMGKYDVVISSYGPESCHMIGRYCKKYMKCKWIADFRDHTYSSMTPRLAVPICKINYWKVKKGADLMTGTAEFTFWNMDTYDFSKIAIISNGYDRQDKQIRDRINEKFTLCYTGNLYYKKSNLNFVFRAIAELIAEGKIESDRISVVYAGNCFDRFMLQAKENGIDYLVTDYGFCSRKESLQLQANSDILLLAVWNSENEEGILTGKVYEYIMNEKPIACSVVGKKGDSQIKKMINEMSLGICCEEYYGESDYIILKQQLAKWYAEFVEKSEVQYGGNRQMCGQFSYEELIKKWIAVIEQVLNNAN